MDFLTQVAPGLGALLIAIAGLITQGIKNKKREQETAGIQQESAKATQEAQRATVTMRDTIDLYESTVLELRNKIDDLKRSEQGYLKNELARKHEIELLREDFAECESRSAHAQREAQGLKNEVISLQAINAGLNVEIVKLIKRVEELLGQIRTQQAGSGT